MECDNDESDAPGARPLDRLLPYLGTYTPPAPYRVFRLIRGGASPLAPIGSNDSDGYDCLTIRLKRSPRLRLVEKSEAFESDTERPGKAPRF